MATVPGLPLSLNTARATFGQGPGSLGAMRRGAGIVPDISANAGVPSGYPIALSDLVGATDYTPLVQGVTQSGGEYFQAEPAPITHDVSGSLVPHPSGGTGSYTHTWSLVNSDGGFTLTWGVSGTGGIVLNATGTVSKNTTRNPVFRYTLSDGVSSVTNDYTLHLHYGTDA